MTGLEIAVLVAAIALAFVLFGLVKKVIVLAVGLTLAAGLLYLFLATEGGFFATYF